MALALAGAGARSGAISDGCAELRVLEKSTGEGCKCREAVTVVVIVLPAGVGVGVGQPGESGRPVG